MEKQIVYVQVEIKSQEDLPKGTGTYFVFVKDDNEIQQWTYNKGSDTDDSIDWLENIDWYLQLVEMPTYEKLKTYADNYSLHAGKSRMAAYQGFLAGFDWLKKELNIE